MTFERNHSKAPHPLGIVLLMSDQLALTIVFERGEDGWVIESIPEVAGIFGQGHNTGRGARERDRRAAADAVTRAGR